MLQDKAYTKRLFESPRLTFRWHKCDDGYRTSYKAFVMRVAKDGRVEVMGKATCKDIRSAVDYIDGIRGDWY